MPLKTKFSNKFLTISSTIILLITILNILLAKNIILKLNSTEYLDLFDEKIYLKIDSVKYFQVEFNGSKIDYSTYSEEIYDATNNFINFYISK